MSDSISWIMAIIHELALKMLGDSLIGFKLPEENRHSDVLTSKYAAIGGGARVSRLAADRSEYTWTDTVSKTRCVYAESTPRRAMGDP